VLTTGLSRWSRHCEASDWADTAVGLASRLLELARFQPEGLALAKEAVTDPVAASAFSDYIKERA
jgi:hypothetical protein